MKSIDQLKKEMLSMRELEALTSMLEQSAARTIAQMRANILDSRAFFAEVWRIYAILKQLAPPPPEVVHKHLVVAIGLDWGMTGNLQHRVLEQVDRIQKREGSDLLIAGKMSRSRFRHQDDRTVHFFPSPKNPTLADIKPIYQIAANYAKVSIVYPSFETLSKQNVLTSSFSVGKKDPSLNPKTNSDSLIAAGRFIVDPDVQALSNYLNQAVVGLSLHHYFQEAILAYSAAQMVAMRNSHDNAIQEGKRLFVNYNRARREAIDAKIRELYASRVAHSKQLKSQPKGVIPL